MTIAKALATLTLLATAASSHAGPFSVAEYTGSISYSATQSGVANPGAIIWSNEPVPMRTFLGSVTYVPNIDINARLVESVPNTPQVVSGSEMFTNFDTTKKIFSEGGQLATGSTSASGAFEPSGATLARFSLSARTTPTTAPRSSTGGASLQIVRAFVVPPLTSVTFTIDGQQSTSIKIGTGFKMSSSVNTALSLMQKAADGAYDNLPTYSANNSYSLPYTTVADSFVTQPRTLTLTYQNTSTAPVSLALIANAKTSSNTLPN